MTKVVSFGEIMLRLKAPGHERLMQIPLMEATFGGGEANVAVSLANYGMDASFVTVLPDNDLAKACLHELRGFGVDIRHVVTGPGRVGIYFLETGSNQRPSKVLYDRANSAIAQARTGDIDWDRAFDGAGWFHTTGITPAISRSAAELTQEALAAAKRLGLTVSLDLNFRKNLWAYGKKASEVMSGLMPYVDCVIANEEDFEMSLGIKPKAGSAEDGDIDPQMYCAVAQEAMRRYPNLRYVAITLRQSLSADRNIWQAACHDGADFILSRRYELTDIVDRVGGGDSFCGGLIYGLNTFGNTRDALEFAAAASCLKHTVSGDYNRVSVAEVQNLMKGSGSGRVQR